MGLDEWAWLSLPRLAPRPVPLPPQPGFPPSPPGESFNDTREQTHKAQLLGPWKGQDEPDTGLPGEARRAVGAGHGTDSNTETEGARQGGRRDQSGPRRAGCHQAGRGGDTLSGGKSTCRAKGRGGCDGQGDRAQGRRGLGGPIRGTGASVLRWRDGL